ncbi:Mucin 2 precursor [hydrothermal vent metagenome]|uniref:Mucin 2 n=1 Tax=hydrothermal vent metagenome TaxID=652676 RepID=A0A3B0YIR4_9ZZZZ
MALKNYPKIIVIALVALFAWLSSTWLLTVDVTQQRNNSLSPSTIELLKRIEGPVVIKAFVTDTDSNKNTHNKLPASQVRKIIKRFINRFKQHKKDITLVLVDHKQDMQTATQYGVVTSRAMVIEYKGQSKVLKRLDQYSFIYTLLQLLKNKKTWIVFIEGHGERSPHQKGNTSLADLGHWLTLRNNTIQTLAIEKYPDVPKNTQVLVIASATKPYSLKALGAIIRYINHGGNLLWLHDPHNKSGLELLANKLGIQIQAGLLVNYNHKQQATLALILKQFPPNKLTYKLNGHMALFPQVSAISASPTSRFKIKTLLKSHPNSWNETNITHKTTKNTLRFDSASDDQKGPLSFGLSLTRTLASTSKQQRIIVIGDSDFLSNGFINRGANHSLAMNIFAWLGEHDELIDVDSPIKSDYLLHFSSWTALLLFILLGVILPITLIVIGVLYYRRRLRRV